MYSVNLDICAEIDTVRRGPTRIRECFSLSLSLMLDDCAPIHIDTPP